MRTSLLPSIKTNMADDGLSYLDDIESLEILEILERRKRSVHPDRENDLDCVNNVTFRSRYLLDKYTGESSLENLSLKSPIGLIFIALPLKIFIIHDQLLRISFCNANGKLLNMAVNSDQALALSLLVVASVFLLLFSIADLNLSKEKRKAYALISVKFSLLRVHNYCNNKNKATESKYGVS
ncbi:hypothetical protein AVEN_92703-1 [Araneus ventricosus]|uniref:Uncharacterized protein n=1 Tax=Araneus ventricosus TaxID=182803 RepID=A0A4Y2HLZ2_ARAVE|nr:hypothetical protein AVEN_92703-1 [Araneus ventricosus]